MRMAMDMSETDRIQWFIQGLNRDLRSKCQFQPNGHSWTDIDKLIEFGAAEAHKIDDSDSDTDRPVLNTVHAPAKRPFPFKKGNGNGKRHRSEKGQKGKPSGYNSDKKKKQRDSSICGLCNSKLDLDGFEGDSNKAFRYHLKTCSKVDGPKR